MELEDIAPDLLGEINARFDDFVKQDKKLTKILNEIKEGALDYDHANQYAERIGELLSRSFQMTLDSSVLPDGKMYFNIAEKVLKPTLTENYNLVSEMCEQVQNALNQASSIGIKAVRPSLNTDRIKGFIERISETPFFDDIKWILGEPIVNYSMSTVDDSVKANMEVQHNIGLNPTVVRIVKYRCCEWCANLAGEYEYPVPSEVFQRHESCRCTVSYNGKKLKAYANRRGVRNTFR